MKTKSLYQSATIFMVVFFIFYSITGIFVHSATAIQTPKDYFGFVPGTDGTLFEYKELINYLKNLEQISPRLKLIKVGESPLGRDIFVAFISSEKNIKNLDNLQDINKKLALDAKIPESDLNLMIKEGKVFVLATLSMHSGEVGPSQASPIIAHKLLTSELLEIQTMLENVVFMMVPCHNPDGMDMVVKHYKKHKGTKYEGCSMPGVYHKYVGHDNNRDFVILSQEDTRAIAGIYNKDWFPQIMVEKHQMGSTTARYFVPPNHDPIAENIDARIWNWNGIFGQNMIKDMTKKGLAGVSQHYLFDHYWPGSTETSLWKNVISLLTEAASVNYATPVFVEPNELKAYGKGLAEYKKSTNMPLPWNGGWWRLGDIVEYEIVSTFSILKTAAIYKKEILTLRNELCRNEVHLGKTNPPYYYILPLQQHDKSVLVGMVNLLKEHGVRVYQLKQDVILNGKTYSIGDIVIPLSQPFRPFIKEVMEKQVFSVRHYTPDGKIIRPYDITSWSLPLHRGLDCIAVEKPVKDLTPLLKKVDAQFKIGKAIPAHYWAVLFNANHNESYQAAFLALSKGLKVDRLNTKTKIEDQCFPKGSFIVYNKVGSGGKLQQIIKERRIYPEFIKNPIKLDTVALKLPRIALVETYFHDMDAGWTRYIFDTFLIPFSVIRPIDFEKTDFQKDYDVVIFPNSSKSILMSGKWKYRGQYYISDYPPQYTTGIGKKGMSRLMTFLEHGGIIIAWGRSASLFTGTLEIPMEKSKKEEFQLPFEDISEKLQKDGFFCPGALMKIELLPDHPITLGMKKHAGAFFSRGLVFNTYIPSFDMDRRVIGKFHEENILMSGYCEKEKKVGNKTILVWLKKNKGQLVLFGFNPQFRASTQGTFKLLFNSILLPRFK